MILFPLDLMIKIIEKAKSVHFFDNSGANINNIKSYTLKPREPKGFFVCSLVKLLIGSKEKKKVILSHVLSLLIIR